MAPNNNVSSSAWPWNYACLMLTLETQLNSSALKQSRAAWMNMHSDWVNGKRNPLSWASWQPPAVLHLTCGSLQSFCFYYGLYVLEHHAQSHSKMRRGFLKLSLLYCTSSLLGSWQIFLASSIFLYLYKTGVFRTDVRRCKNKFVLSIKLTGISTTPPPPFKDAFWFWLISGVWSNWTTWAFFCVFMAFFKNRVHTFSHMKHTLLLLALS